MQMFCIAESTCDIVGTFRRPHSELAPGKLCPPRYAPDCNAVRSNTRLPPKSSRAPVTRANKPLLLRKKVPVMTLCMLSSQATMTFQGVVP